MASCWQSCSSAGKARRVSRPWAIARRGKPMSSVMSQRPESAADDGVGVLGSPEHADAGTPEALDEHLVGQAVIVHVKDDLAVDVEVVAVFAVDGESTLGVIERCDVGLGVLAARRCEEPVADLFDELLAAGRPRISSPYPRVMISISSAGRRAPVSPRSQVARIQKARPSYPGSRTRSAEAASTRSSVGGTCSPVL